MTARQAESLRAASLRIYAYLPYYAYLVKMRRPRPWRHVRIEGRCGS